MSRYMMLGAGVLACVNMNLYFRKDSRNRYPSGRLAEYLKAEETDLFQWVKRGETDVTKICLGKREDGVRGIFVTDHIQCGQTICSLDTSLLFSTQNPESLQGCTWISRCIFQDDKLVDGFDAQFHDQAGKLALSLLVAYHDRLGKKSSWHPFIEVLPRNSWLEESDEEKKAFKHFKSIISDLDWMEFHWAYSMVHSRIFLDSSKLKWNVFRYEHPMLSCMYPIGDLANHSDQPTSIAMPWKFVALRDLEPGDEITWDYSDFRSSTMNLIWTRFQLLLAKNF